MDTDQLAEWQLFSQLFQYAPIGMTLVSTERNILRANPSFCELIGYTEEELSGLHISDITYEEDVEANLNSLQALVDSKSDSFCMEKRFIHKEGHLIWVLLSVSLVRGLQGNPHYFISQIQDIGVQKAYLDQMNHLYRQNQLILNHAGEGIFGVDLEGRTTFVNPTALRMTGFTAEELIGFPQHDLIHHSKKDGTVFPQEECPIYASFRDGMAYSENEDVFWRKDGTSFPVEYISTPIVDNDEVLGSVVLFKDISQQKEYIDELRKREKHLSQAQKIAHFGSWEWNLSNHTVYISDSLMNILEVSHSIGMMHTFMNNFHVDDKPFIERSLQESLRGKEFDIEARIVLSNGRMRYVQIIGEPMYDAQGHLYKVMGTTQDITERIQSQQQMREHQELYKLLSDNAQDIISYLSSDGVIRNISESIVVAGYEPKEIVGKSIEDFVHPDDLDAVLSQALLSDSDVSRYEWRARHKNNDYIWYETVSRKIRNRNGDVEKILGISRDISFKKQAEEKLKRSEEKYRFIADHTTDMIATRTSDGVYTYISPASYRLLGSHPDELIGMNCSQLIHPDDYRSLVPSYKDLLQNNQDTNTFVHRLRRKDGQYIWVESSLTIIRDRDNHEAMRILTSSRDITKRIQYELHLQESEERYRRLVETSLDTIVISNGEVWKYINEAGKKLFGLKNTEEWVGKSFLDFVHSDYHEQTHRQIKEVLEQGKIVEIGEQKCYTVDGQLFDVEVIGIPTLFENQPAVQLIIRDITERKKALHYMVLSEKLTTVSQMAAGIAHEIRNPLTAIKGFIQLIKDRVPNESYFFSIIIDEIKRVELILNELLILSKPKGTQWAEKNIHVLLDHVVTLLKTQAIIKNIDIITAYDDDNLSVWCDENSLKQVFINLIKNAIEAMDKGGEIHLETKLLDGRVEIILVDQGCGIPKDKLDKIGTPFYTTKSNGTGLGMMISFNIIQQHQGEIHIESEVNQGTTFKITFPIVKTTIQP